MSAQQAEAKPRCPLDPDAIIMLLLSVEKSRDSACRRKHRDREKGRAILI